MAWVRLDDNFAEHPKVLRAGAEGVALWVAGLAYCNRQSRRDGVIPTEKVPLLYPVSRPMQVAARLVQVGLWVPVDGGYRVHDYDEFQPSEDLRRKRAEAGRRGGLRSGEARRQATPEATHEARTEHTGSKPDATCLNPVPVPVPEKIKGLSHARAREAGDDDGTAGHGLIRHAVPDLPPFLALLDRAGARQGLQAEAEKAGCLDLAVRITHWHAKRLSVRADQRTWRSDWIEDLRAWLLDHPRFGGPCQARSTTVPAGRQSFQERERAEDERRTAEITARLAAERGTG